MKRIDEQKLNVLLTGATSGIGQAIARWFALNRSQDTLILVGRREAALDAMRSELEAKDIRTYTVCQDLARPDAAQNVFNAVHARPDCFPIDILINNAGIGYAGLFSDGTLERDDAMIRLNIQAVTELTRLFLPDILHRRGKILQLSSTGAYQPGSYTAVYYATKAYVHQFSLALADELRGTGVQVTIVCPGTTASAFARKAGKKEPSGAMSPERVAAAACQGLFKGKKLVIPGRLNRLLVLLSKLAPGSLSACIVRRIQKPLCYDAGHATSPNDVVPDEINSPDDADEQVESPEC